MAPGYPQPRAGVLVPLAGPPRSPRIPAVACQAPHRPPSGELFWATVGSWEVSEAPQVSPLSPRPDHTPTTCPISTGPPRRPWSPESDPQAGAWSSRWRVRVTLTPSCPSSLPSPCPLADPPSKGPHQFSPASAASLPCACRCHLSRSPCVCPGRTLQLPLTRDSADGIMGCPLKATSSAPLLLGYTHVRWGPASFSILQAAQPGVPRGLL